MNAIPLVEGLILSGVFLGLIGLFWVLMVLTPRWTRPDIYFSVTIRPEFRRTPEAECFEERYRKHVAYHSLVACGLTVSSLLALSIPALSLGLVMGGLLWAVVGGMAAVATTRQQVLPYAAAPATTREAALQPRRTTLAGRWWWLGPPLVAAAVSAYLALRWHDIPSRFPIHWGPSGRPDNWANRSLASVFAEPLLLVVLWLMMLGLAAALARFSRRIFARGSGAAREGKFLNISQWILLGSAYWIAALTATTSLMPLLVGMNDPLPAWFYAIPASELVIVAIVIVILARIGQGGWRLGNGEAKAAAAGEAPIGDHTPDAAWKLGLFYYNPDDPAFFVQRRFGIGWDLNWGRPGTWLMLLALLALPLAAVLVLSQLMSGSH